MRRLTFATLIALAPCLAGCGATPAPSSLPPDPARPAIRVMTFNVNYGLEGDAATIEAIRRGAADVIVLQETTRGWETALRRSFGDELSEISFVHAGGAGGLALLSRYPIVEEEIIDPPEGGWFPAWRLILETPLGRVQLLAVHLRPPISDGGSVVSGYLSTPSVRADEIAAYERRLDPDLPTIVLGDFNENEDGRAIGRLRARGMRSVHDELIDTRTWRWQTSVGEITSTLDHVVYDERLRPIAARVIEAGRSDHLPVVADLVLAE